MNPNPDCQLECRFHWGPSMTTCMYFAPVYDKHGNNLNPDANITTATVNCTVCNKTWTASTRLGDTKFVEANNGRA